MRQGLNRIFDVHDIFELRRAYCKRLGFIFRLSRSSPFAEQHERHAEQQQQFFMTVLFQAQGYQAPYGAPGYRRWLGDGIDLRRASTGSHIALNAGYFTAKGEFWDK